MEDSDFSFTLTTVVRKAVKIKGQRTDSLLLGKNNKKITQLSLSRKKRYETASLEEEEGLTIKESTDDGAGKEKADKDGREDCKERRSSRNSSARTRCSSPTRTSGSSDGRQPPSPLETRNTEGGVTDSVKQKEEEETKENINPAEAGMKPYARKRSEHSSGSRRSLLRKLQENSILQSSIGIVKSVNDEPADGDSPNDFIELAKVSLRKHQHSLYRRNIKNDKLFFKKRVIKNLTQPKEGDSTPTAETKTSSEGDEESDNRKSSELTGERVEEDVVGSLSASSLDESGFTKSLDEISTSILNDSLLGCHPLATVKKRSKSRTRNDSLLLPVDDGSSNSVNGDKEEPVSVRYPKEDGRLGNSESLYFRELKSKVKPVPEAVRSPLDESSEDAPVRLRPPSSSLTGSGSPGRRQLDASDDFTLRAKSSGTALKKNKTNRNSKSNSRNELSRDIFDCSDRVDRQIILNNNNRSNEINDGSSRISENDIRKSVRYGKSKRSRESGAADDGSRQRQPPHKFEEKETTAVVASSPHLTKEKLKDITRWLSSQADGGGDRESSPPTPEVNKRHSAAEQSSSDDREDKQPSSSSYYTPPSCSYETRKGLQVTSPERAHLGESSARRPRNKVDKASTAVRARRNKSVQKTTSSSKDDGKEKSKKKVESPATRILDSLYGREWRQQDVVTLTRTEPTKKRRTNKKAAEDTAPLTGVRPNQKKKKKHNPSSMFSSSSSGEDNFVKFLEEERRKRLTRTERLERLQNMTLNGFIAGSSDEEELSRNSVGFYNGLIGLELRREAEVLSSRGGERSDNDGDRNCSRMQTVRRRPRRLSFGGGGTEEEETVAPPSGGSEKNKKKKKKKSPDKIVKRHVPLRISSKLVSASSGKNKSTPAVNRKKTNDEKVLEEQMRIGRLLFGGARQPDSGRAPVTAKKAIAGSVRVATPTTSTKKKAGEQPLFTKTPSHTLSFLGSLSAVTGDLRCHPDAVHYKKNFKTKKEELARKLFALYNREVFKNKIPGDTLLQWNGRMISTSGFCYSRRTIQPGGGILRSSRIVLSSKILDTADRLRDTLIHEMCHAATWIINGVTDGHGPNWKYWAQQAMDRFPELPAIKRCHDYKINTKYTYKCLSCGYSIGRHTKSLDTERKRCGYCYGRFELLVNVRTAKGSGQATSETGTTTSAEGSGLRTPRAATGFALFVKENYVDVKRSDTDLLHGDVMKLLVQKFSQVKANKAQLQKQKDDASTTTTRH